MNKKYLNVILFSALMIGTAGTFTSCKDYDDEISDLQTQINANKVTLDELKGKIENGFVITKCEKNGEGVLITFSNGQTCQLYNGAKGDNGGAGKDADVWTIGNDGYWYKNGKVTEYKAIGSDGVGTPGDNGNDGENGWYYKPNTVTGCFDIYQLDDAGKEKFVKSTEISWKVDGGSQNGISVVLDGNKLTVDGATDKNGEVITTPVEISLGQPLGSVAFVPDVIDATINYPTTTGEFFHLPTYWDETKYNAATKVFIDQADFDKSNAVEMIYRLNPSNAYTENAVLGFINREVSTRAIAGDKQTLLNALADSEIDEGTAIVNATINASALSATKHNFAALQVFVGQVPVTSDYIVVKSEAIGAVLADSVKTIVGSAAVEFYPRTKSIKGATENDAFVKSFVTLANSFNFDFKYENNGKPGEIDLNKKVGLYTNNKMDYLYALGFTGMTYEFSLPEEYKGDDAQKTNQQWFVKETSEGVFAVDETHLTGGLTSAIGRTPVVRVDAFLTNNAGTKKLVASSYIKLYISATASIEKDPNEIMIAPDQSLVYQSLEAANTKVAQMEWQRINNEMYGKEGLTAATFWGNYGGASKQYEVKVTTIEKAGTVKELLKKSDVAGNVPFTNSSIPGITLSIDLNESNVQTSDIKIDVNNKVLTENTYKDINGKGAEYTVTITIKANEKTAHGDFILTQKFYVNDVCKAYDLNELYQIPGQNSVQVKGQLNASSVWEMSSVVSEHFKKDIPAGSGKNIFAYWKDADYVDAAKALTFEWATGTTGVTPTAAFTTDQAVALDGAMTKDSETKVMTYTVPLANGEECDFDYNIIFLNPFKGVAPSAVKLYGNGIGDNKVSVQPQVNVTDRENDLIYSWDELTKALVLSAKATGTYHVAVPTVAYAFDTTEADYKTLTSQMSANSDLKVGATDGIVIWKNEGTTLQKDFTLTVIATVTFKDLSEVTIRIPVTLTKNK